MQGETYVISYGNRSCKITSHALGNDLGASVVGSPAARMEQVLRSGDINRVVDSEVGSIGVMLGELDREMADGI